MAFKQQDTLGLAETQDPLTSHQGQQEESAEPAGLTTGIIYTGSLWPDYDALAAGRECTWVRTPEQGRPGHPEITSVDPRRF